MFRSSAKHRQPSPRRATSRRQRWAAATAAASLVAVSAAGVAVADTLYADGDGLTPVTDSPILALGDICSGSFKTGALLLGIRRNGGDNVTFKAGSSPSISADAPSSPSIVSAFTDGAIMLPSTWVTTAANQITLDTARAEITATGAGAPGQKTGTIVFRAVGTAENNTSLSREVTVTVSWTVITCVPPDTTGPTASPTQSPAANAAGWNNTDVTVDWNWSDNDGGSGIDNSNCTTSSTSSGEGTITLTASCMDLAGNQGSSSYNVKVDKTPPTISATITPASPASTGWYNSTTGAPTVSFTCGDTGGSGLVDSCPDPLELSDGAGQSVTRGPILDVAGNISGTAEESGIDVDLTAPSVAVTGVSNGATYTLGSVPAADCDTTDALSDVKTDASLSLSGGPVGSVTATCSGAEDNAGNTGSASVTYSVVYDWTGFFRPIDNGGVLNSVKAGSAVPVKFSLAGDQGLNIFAAGFPKSQVISCDSSALVDPIESTVTAGNSSLSYDPVADQYNYVWKTDKAWANSCRQLTVTLADGTSHYAKFKLLK